MLKKPLALAMCLFLTFLGLPVANAVETPPADLGIANQQNPSGLSLNEAIQKYPGFDRYLKLEQRLHAIEDPNATENDVDVSVSRSASRSANPHRTDDDRIGHLVLSGIAGTDLVGGACTAAHVGGRYWLSAKHCVFDQQGNRITNPIGFIMTSDGDYAGIEDFVVHDHADLMLIRVGTGLSHKPSFNLSKDLPTNGEIYRTLGYCGRSYSSTSDLKADYYKGGYKLRNFSDWFYFGYRFHPHRSYAIGHGDSGGPVFRENTLYGVISGSRGEDSNTDPSAEKQKVTVNVVGKVPYWLDFSRRTLYKRSKWDNVLAAFSGGVLAGAYDVSSFLYPSECLVGKSEDHGWSSS